MRRVVSGHILGLAMKKRSTYALGLLIAAAALVTASPSFAATPCTDHACSARVRVDDVTRWASPQRLAGRLDELSVSAGGRELRYQPAGDCVAYFSGHGVGARISICGTGKVRIRMRAARLGARPVTVRVVYRVAPSA